MAEPEIVYCSDYEELTGKKIPTTEDAPAGVIETKVIEAPEAPVVAPATVAETA